MVLLLVLGIDGLSGAVGVSSVRYRGLERPTSSFGNRSTGSRKKTVFFLGARPLFLEL